MRVVWRVVCESGEERELVLLVTLNVIAAGLSRRVASLCAHQQGLYDLQLHLVHHLRAHFWCAAQMQIRQPEAVLVVGVRSGKQNAQTAPVLL